MEVSFWTLCSQLLLIKLRVRGALDSHKNSSSFTIFLVIPTMSIYTHKTVDIGEMKENSLGNEKSKIGEFNWLSNTWRSPI